MYLVAVPAEAKDPGFPDDIPENDIAVLAPGGEEGASVVVSEDGSCRLVAIERGLARALLTVPEAYAPVGVPARNLITPKGTKGLEHEVK